MPSGTQKVFIVGPNRFQNEIMADLIEKDTGLSCVARQTLEDVPWEKAKNAPEARLVFLDCKNFDVKALCCLLQRQAVEHLKHNIVALFNLGKDLKMEKRALTCGVRGLFYENDSGESLSKGIQTLIHGELWATRKVMTECLFDNDTNLPASELSHNLTDREGEILTLLAMGSTNVAIADQLCISPHTVKTHIYNIFKKINVPNRMQAALWAAKHL